MGRKRILVVDDDAAVLKFLQAKLSARFDILPTSAPRDVLRLAREMRPHLILCDLDMPGMDGGDVSRSLFADDGVRDIPVLFLTALASAADIARVTGQVGGRPAISKKAPLPELVARIEQLLQ